MKKMILLVLLFAVQAVATVSDGESIRQYFVCSGSTTTFTFTFKCNSSDDVLVYNHIIATGDEGNPLVEDTDYTIAATGTSYLNGGVVTISPALESTSRVVIVRNIKKSQETSSGAMSAAAAVLALDKLTRVVQDLQDRNDRSIHLQESDGTGFNMELADLETRATTYLGMDSDGDLTYFSATITDGATVSSFMAGVVDKSTDVLVMATLNGIPVLNVKNSAYGAVGNGSADDTAAVQAAFDALTNGSMLVFPPGTYNMDAITLPTMTNVRIVGIGYPEIKFTSVTASAVMWKYEPSAIVTTSINSNITAGDNTLSFASSPAGVVAGDIVRVETTGLLYPTDATYLAGIMKEVETIGTTTTIYGTSETDITSGTATVKFYKPLRNVTFEGFRFTLAEDSDQYAIDIRNASVNVTVKDCIFNGPGDNKQGVGVAGIGTKIHHNTFEGFNDSNLLLGYGVAVNGHDIQVHNNNFRFGKHAVTSGSHLFVTTNVWIADNYVEDPSGVALDAHGGVWYVTFSGNKIVDIGKTFPSTANGIYIRGNNSTVVHNLIKAADGVSVSNGIVIIEEASDNIKITDNDIIGAFVHGVKADGTTNDEFTNFVMNYNRIDGKKSANNEYAFFGSTASFTDSSFIGNRFIGMSNNGLYLQAATNTHITNNYIEYGFDTAGAGLTIAGLTDTTYKNVIISSNIFKPLNAAASANIKIFDNQNNVTIVNNIQDTSVSAETFFQNSTTGSLTRLDLRNNIGGETIPAMTTGDATPSVAGITRILSVGTTTITDFDDGFTNQVFTFIAESSITITDGTHIFLSGSGNFSMTDTDTLTLIQKADGKWYEMGRGDNGA